MSWSRSPSFWASACVWLASTACTSTPRVQLLGESTRLAQSQPSPVESAVFDGKSVHLRGARGETLGLQLRISDRRARRARLELPPQVARVTGFAVRSLEVKEASSSMYGPSSGAGLYPDVLVPTQGVIRTSELAYFDIDIPAGASPGRYTGSFELDGASTPVILDVSSARIDLRRDPLVWVFYLPREIARVHGLPDVDDSALLERESAYHELFRAHGAFLAADLPPARFEVRRRFVHDVKYWPVAIDTASDQAIERDVRSWLELFRGTGVTPFAIPVDEPRNAAERERARQVAQAIGRAGGGRPGLLRGVTDAQDSSYGDTIDVFLSPANFPAAARERGVGGKRFWTYNGRPPGAGSMILDTDGIALRTWGWIAERYDIGLWYAWEGLYFTDRYNGRGPTDVVHDALTFDQRARGGEDWGNGDGLLAYPGPLPSLRLKALRRGLQDRLLLRELMACGGVETAQRILQRVVPRALGEARGAPSWSLEEPVWERARYEVLDAIEHECND